MSAVQLASRSAIAGAAAISAAAILLIAPAIGSGPSIIPSASADGCPDVEVVFARGTSEAPGIGRVGQALADALQGQVGGRTVGTYGVNYPATYDFLAAADGATDATNHILGMAQECPNTRIVLGGYSQGAAVVDMLVGIPPVGDRIGEIGSAPPLPGNVSGNIAAVAAFGNPATKFGNPVTAAPSPYGRRSIDLCNDGDPICSQGRNPFAHTSYESTGMPGQAAGFAAGLI